MVLPWFGGPEVHVIYFCLVEEAGNFWRQAKFYSSLKTGSAIA